MIFADSLRENAEENGFYFGNGEKILSPTLSLRETTQSKGEGDAIRRVLVGLIMAFIGWLRVGGSSVNIELQ